MAIRQWGGWIFLVLVLPWALAGQAGKGRETIRRGALGDGAALHGAPRLTSWNIERGEQFEGVAAALLGAAGGEILLLQEVDVFAGRSGRRDVPEELARRLGMSYAFAAEFEELGQGSSTSPAYHGQAVLVKGAMGRVWAIRFKEQSDYWRPRWWVPNWAIFQRRIGGRLAMAAEFEAGGRNVVVYNVHLESRGAESMRLSEMREVLVDAAKHPATTAVVIAGDLNVSGKESPVIRAIMEAGFQMAVGGEVTTARGAPLDWIFIKGPVSHAEGKVGKDVLASDHYPVTVRLKVGD